MKTMLSVAAMLAALALPAPLPAREANEVREGHEVQVETATLPTVADVLARANAPGVREVEIRGLELTPAQVNDAFLSTNAQTNVLVQIGRQLKPGQEIDFRTADGQRFRVQNEGGQLRVRVRDANVANRAALARFLAVNGIGRVEIRGVDAAGHRVRLEVRDGVIKKDEVKADHRGPGPAEMERAGRVERAGKIERPERPQRAEKVERIERPERADRSGRH